MRAVLVFGLLTAAFILVEKPTCAAPRPVLITPADRVRIQTVPDPEKVPAPLRGKFVGSITDISAGKITVMLEGGQPAVVHRNLIVGLEKSVDRGSRAKHTFAGALIGALVGGVIGALSADENSDEFIQFSAQEMAAIGVIYLAPVGALVGAVLPAGQSWETVPLERVEWKPVTATRGFYE